MPKQPLDILLVDDNDDDVLLVRESFEEARLVNIIHVVRDGEEAMKYLRREGKYKKAKPPGMVLLDINMPKKNGFEVLEEMKADPRLRLTPVVILTTSDRDDDIIKSYSNGACSFITKPVSFDKLKEVAQQFSLYWALVSEIPPARQ
jgi:CheY-like chemotaxis protein